MREIICKLQLQESNCIAVYKNAMGEVEIEANCSRKRATDVYIHFFEKKINTHIYIHSERSVYNVRRVML
jgi:hypothetical protein